VSRVAAMLKEHGFDVQPNESVDEDWISIAVTPPAAAISEARRLRSLLEAHGVRFDEETCMAASYDPVSDLAVIDVFGVSDGMVAG
jgi:hypothetical protein